MICSDISLQFKSEFRSLFYTIIRVKSKWIKDLNVRLEVIQLLKENIEGKPLHINVGNNYFGIDNKRKSNKNKNKLVGLHQILNFCTAEEAINKIKRKPTKLEKKFAKNISDEGLISKLFFKNSYNSISNNPIKKRQRNWIDILFFSKEDIQIASVQFSSVARSCPMLCDSMNHSTPGLPVPHHLPEFT